MLGDKQQQSATGGALAIQAGGDVNYHGMQLAEVKELCALFLKDNFPQLREEARRVAEEQVRSFATGLEQTLVNGAASIVMDKFREPDVQATINDAVQASARKGFAANPQILATLISERVGNKSTSFTDIVLSEAVRVAPLLTPAHIGCLSLVHFCKAMAISNVSQISNLENHGRGAIQFATPGFGLSDAQLEHLQYAGVATINQLIGGDIYEQLARAPYAKLGLSGASFKLALESQAPSYAKVLSQFTKDGLFKISLTSVGQAIAIANISNTVGPLDYRIWLN